MASVSHVGNSCTFCRTKLTHALRASLHYQLLNWCQCCVLEVCETLDRRKGVDSSEMWPPPPVVPDADAVAGSAAQTGNTDVLDDEDTAQHAVSWEDWPVQAKLAMLLDYLRQNYHYCIFCGCQVCVHTEPNIFKFVLVCLLKLDLKCADCTCEAV